VIVGHSCLPPFGVVVRSGRSSASISPRPSLGLGIVDKCRTGRGGSGFSCGSGLSIDSEGDAVCCADGVCVSDAMR
jgi:hypothetical protein